MPRNLKNGTTIMRVACAIFFLLFTFLYLFEYQCDILAVLQHVLSKGATHYQRLIGATIITAVLWGIQLCIYAATGLKRRAHALTYLPSLLLLAILTDVSPNIDQGCYLGHWLWVFPLLMIAYGGAIWTFRQLEPLEPANGTTGLFSRMAWTNLLTMGLMALCVCEIGNHDRVFHYRMRVEQALLNNDFTTAAAIGKDDAATDSSLTMLRFWALCQKRQLGEKLFEYPLVGHSRSILPNGRSVKLMMVPEKRIYEALRVYFLQPLPPKKYLEFVHKKHRATPRVHDALLCAYLLDCDLDQFARHIGMYYDLKSALPKHYQEALLLYTHLRQQPAVVYTNPVMDADFNDFQTIIKANGTETARYASLRDTYGKSYWFYYYCNHGKIL